LTPIQMKVFSRPREVTDAIKRKSTGTHYWLLWPFYGFLVTVSAVLVLIEKMFGLDDTTKGFWAWISPPEKTPEEIAGSVDNQ